MPSFSLKTSLGSYEWLWCWFSCEHEYLQKKYDEILLSNRISDILLCYLWKIISSSPFREKSVKTLPCPEEIPLFESPHPCCAARLLVAQTLISHRLVPCVLACSRNKNAVGTKCDLQRPVIDQVESSYFLFRQSHTMQNQETYIHSIFSCIFTPCTCVNADMFSVCAATIGESMMSL